MPSVKSVSVKKVNLDWHLIGLLPLAFGIISYVIAIAQFTSLLGLLWVCPFTAILTGIVLLFLPHSRFAVSAVAVWIFLGPLMPALFETIDMLQIHQFHHFMSSLALFVILYHIKEIWNTKGFLFGFASFYAFVIITLNLSGGVVNLLTPFKTGGQPAMWLGVISAVASIVIFLWYKPGFKFSSKKIIK